MKVYAYTVCVISIVSLLFITPMTVYEIVTILSPDLTVPTYEYEKFLNGEYTEDQYKNILVITYKNAIQDFISYSMAFALAVGLWLIHWKIAKRLDVTSK